MTGTVIVLERMINATMDEVWDTITDLGHLETTRQGVRHLRLLSDGGYEVGTRWSEERSILGHHGEETCEVIEASPPHHTMVESWAGHDRITTAFALTPVGKGTRVAMTVHADMSKRPLLGRLAWSIFGGFNDSRSRRMLRRDLDRIAQAAEHRHEEASPAA